MQGVAPTHSTRAPLTALGLFAGFATLGYVGGHTLTYWLLGLTQHDAAHTWVRTSADLGGAASLLSILGAIVMAARTMPRIAAWLRDGNLVLQIVLAAVVPAATYVAGEHLERLAAGHAAHVDARVLLLGTALQLVLGLLALAAMRLTLRAATALHAALRAPHRRRPTALLPPTPAQHLRSARGTVLASQAAGRAPPRASVTP